MSNRALLLSAITSVGRECLASRSVTRRSPNAIDIRRPWLATIVAPVRHDEWLAESHLKRFGLGKPKLLFGLFLLLQFGHLFLKAIREFYLVRRRIEFD